MLTTQYTAPHQILHATRIPSSSTHPNIKLQQKIFFPIPLTQHSRFSDQRRRRRRRRHSPRPPLVSSRLSDNCLCSRVVWCRICVESFAHVLVVSACVCPAITTIREYMLFPFQQKFLYLIKRSLFFSRRRRCCCCCCCGGENAVLPISVFTFDMMSHSRIVTRRLIHTNTLITNCL